MPHAASTSEREVVVRGQVKGLDTCGDSDARPLLEIAFLN